MGVYKKKAADPENGKAVSRRKSAAATAGKSVGKAAVTGKPSPALKEQEERQKVLETFHPKVLDWFRENLGIDLAKQPAEFIHDIKQGKMTNPVQVVVTPLAWDKESRKNVAMPRINPVLSIMANLPFENGKMVAPDDKHKVYIQSVAPRALLEKADGSATEEAVEPSVASAGKDAPKFTEAMLMAAEGVGINRERLYGGFNHLSSDQKRAILDGDVFEVSGAVKTSFGLLNVSGEARMNVAKDGSVRMDYRPIYPEPMSADKVIDIIAARRIGTLELDIFRRDGAGHIMKDVNGAPLLNRAGENLVTYGNALEPVLGYTHTREYDKDQKKFVDHVEHDWYQVSAVTGKQYNAETGRSERVVLGNLHARAMDKAPDLNPDGTKVTYTDRNGKEAVRTHPVVKNPRVTEGKVFLEGQGRSPFPFKTERDMQDFLGGRGGVVSGVSYHDFKTGKDVIYDAFVYHDHVRGGFGHAFTPSTSEALIARRDEQQRKTTVKKQNFGIGF